MPSAMLVGWSVNVDGFIGLSLNQWEDFFKEMLFVDFVNFSQTGK